MTGIVTRIATRFTGNLVGQDDNGHQYFQAKKASTMPGSLLRYRRWVLYKGQPEPSSIPPEWHAWIHHIVDEVPTDDNVVKYAWQQDHQPNMTGTNRAYRPTDTTASAAKRDDYQAWSPE